MLEGFSVVSFLDRIIEEVDQGLKVLSGSVSARRSLDFHASDVNLTDEQKKNISQINACESYWRSLCSGALFGPGFSGEKSGHKD